MAVFLKLSNKGMLIIKIPISFSNCETILIAFLTSDICSNTSHKTIQSGVCGKSSCDKSNSDLLIAINPFEATLLQLISDNSTPAREEYPLLDS